MKPNSNSLINPKLIQSTRQLSPGREQWALINQYKALQYERLKEKERLLAQQKKNNFRRQLDNQLNSKNNVQQQQVQADRRYYEFITNQANMSKEKQQRDRYQKYMKRRQVQEQNNKLLQMSKNSRLQDQQQGYNLEIGHKSEMQRKRNTEMIKKNVLDTLDEQLRQKWMEKQMNKKMEYQTDIKNLQYQYEKHDNRPQPQKGFGQNQRVYQYYREIDQIKRMKDRELEQKIVDQAAERKRQQDENRVRNEQMKKFMIKETVKETLDQQVKQHYLKKYEESKINPEEYSYGVISNVFREKGAAYDKNKYVEELRQQAEEQRRKKKMENYMTEEEYRMNMNQLNKVVNGEYAHNSYLDRSMGTIGDNRQLRLADIRDSIYNKDAELVKQRLQSLKQRSNSHVMSRSGRSDRSF